MTKAYVIYQEWGDYSSYDMDFIKVVLSEEKAKSEIKRLEIENLILKDLSEKVNILLSDRLTTLKLPQYPPCPKEPVMTKFVDEKFYKKSMKSYEEKLKQWNDGYEGYRIKCNKLREEHDKEIIEKVKQIIFDSGLSLEEVYGGNPTDTRMLQYINYSSGNYTYTELPLEH